MSPRFFSASPESPNESLRSSLPLPEEFEAADTNNDNVIDKNESGNFFKKKQERGTPSALWILGIIFSLSLLACLCTPGPAKIIKENLFKFGSASKDKWKSFIAWIKIKTKKSS